MQKLYKIKVDITKKYTMPAFEVNTNDLKSIRLSIEVLNGASPLDLKDKTVRIAIRKPDNHIVFQDCTITDATNGQVEVILENQAYITPGTHTAEIMCYKGSDVVAVSGTFSYKSSKGIMNDEAVESKTEFTAINRTIEEAERILEDLRENGGGVGVDEQARQGIQDVTKQLADTVKEVNGVKPTNGKVTLPIPEVDTSNLRLKTEKISQNDISDELKQQMAGDTPINAVPAKRSISNEYIAEKAVTRTKTSFYRNTSKNLFDKNEIIPGGSFNFSNGNFVASETYVSSNFIKCNPAKTYKTTNSGHVCFWDSTGKFISGINGTDITNIPSNADTMTFAINKSVLNTFMVVEGSSLPSVYEPPMYIDESLKLTVENANDSNFMSGFGDKIAPYVKATKSNADFINRSQTVNLFDKDKANRNGYYNSSTGNFVVNTTYWATDFIPCAPNDRFRVSVSGHVTFWDENKRFVSGVNSGQPYIVPDNPNIKYAIFTITASSIDTAMVVKGETLPTSYVPPYSFELTGDVKVSKVKSELENMKWATLGDSITFGLGATSPYHNIIAQKYNMTIYNHGISGTRIASVEGQTNAMVDRFNSMQSDAEIITVFGGTNDYASDVPLGNISSTDKTTFYGALNVLCLGLIQRYPGKRIGFITPMSRRNVDYAKMLTYINAIKEVCGRYSIPTLDMFHGGGLHPSDANINTLFFSNADGLHPNNEGHKVIARRIESFIKSL